MSEELKRKLKEARERLGLSQQGFADKLGMSKRTLQDWEQDRSTPDQFKEKALLDKIRRLK